ASFPHSLPPPPTRPPPTSPLFPYTTLFRSRLTRGSLAEPARRRRRSQPSSRGSMDHAASSRPLSSAACGSSSACGRCRSSRRSRSEEHTSELQSRGHLVCRLLLEKKKNERQ